MSEGDSDDVASVSTGSDQNESVLDDFGDHKTYDLVDTTSNITRLSKKRDILKLRSESTLEKLSDVLSTEGESRHGGRTRIIGYVNNVTDYLSKAEELNDQISSLVGDDKQEEVLMWYEKLLERVSEARLRAEIYFDEHKKTIPSPPSSLDRSRAADL